MLPAEELELKILAFVDAQVQGDWRPTSISEIRSTLQLSNDGILSDALKDFCDKEILEIRTWSDLLGWSQYTPHGNDFHYFIQREFRAKLTHAGRKRLELLNELKEHERNAERMPALMLLEQAGYNEARNQLMQAHEDLQKKPLPDVTGAVQHAMAAFECIARTLLGLQNKTLGEILKKHSAKLGIPKRLDQSMEKAWGFASDIARHVNEGKRISFPEAEIMVSLTQTMIIYLLRKNKPELGA